MRLLTPLLLSIVAVFAPIHAVLTTVLVLVLADLALGIWAAHRRGERLTSYGLRRTAVKLFVYELALGLGFLAETYLMSDALPVVKLLGGLIGVSELKSILENLNTLVGGDLFKSLLDRLNGPQTDKHSGPGDGQ